MTHSEKLVLALTLVPLFFATIAAALFQYLPPHEGENENA